MITIGRIRYREEAETARIEADIHTDGQADFLLYFEVEKAWAKYLVTDRADAFLVGILNQAMLKGHDIRCQDPVSAELKVMLERQLIYTLAKHDKKLYATKIFADLTDEPLDHAGAVGTGLSMGLDSFTTIAENYNVESSKARLTHLLTFTGLVGGFYGKNNWDYCAEKLYEREKKVAQELNLPLVAVNTNLPKFMHPRVDYYVTYMLVMAVMSLGKLFRTYYISSNGEDFSYFDIKETGLHDCEVYDLLTIHCCTLQGGVRFLSGGGEKDRLDKLRVISEFPIARKYLQSCLAQHYNCMTCQKCKRNLVSMDALGILDKFSDVYDISYYREHREEYIEWMCQQVQMNNHAADYIRPAYDLIRKREPELIEKYTCSMEELVSQRNEFKRQRNVYKQYTQLYYQLMIQPDWDKKLKEWFKSRNIHNIIVYGNGPATQLLIGLRNIIEIKIDYIVATPIKKQKYGIPCLPENCIDYPYCDAVIICNVDKPESIKKKLDSVLKWPLYEIKEVLELR